MSSVNKVAHAVSLYADGRSLPDAHKETGVPMSTIRSAAIRAGIPMRSRADGVRLASAKLSASRTGKKRAPFTALHRRRISVSKLASARGVGVSVKPSGYVEYTKGPNKGRSVHVVTMEQHIGRRLAKDECVHHIDENRSNNELSNLRLMTRAAHTRLHRTGSKQ